MQQEVNVNVFIRLTPFRLSNWKTWECVLTGQRDVGQKSREARLIEEGVTAYKWVLLNGITAFGNGRRVKLAAADRGENENG